MLDGPLNELMNYWRALPRQSGVIIPMRREFHPGDIAGILPRISLMKRISQDTIVVGLVGTAVDALWDVPLTGMNIFDLASPRMKINIARFYGAILNQPCGAYIREKKKSPDGVTLRVSSLYLPMTDRLGAPNYIIGCSVFQSKYTGLANKAGAPLSDRLVLEQSHIKALKFIDLGFGLPDIQFETVPPRHPMIKRPPPENWWNRFIPAFRGDGHRQKMDA